MSRALDSDRASTFEEWVELLLGAFSEAYASGIAIGKYASALASDFVVSIGDSVNERGMFSGRIQFH